MAEAGQEALCSTSIPRLVGCSKKIIVYFKQHKKKNSGFLRRFINLALTCLDHSNGPSQLEGNYL